MAILAHGRAVEFEVRDGQVAPGFGLECASVGGAGGKFAGGDLGGNASGDDGREVFGAGAVAGFLITAVDDGRKVGAAVTVKDADAFRSVEAAGRTGEQIDASGLDIDGKPTGGGDGIDEERDAAGAGDLAEGGDGLDGADVEIRVVSTDENGVGTERDVDGGGIDPAIGSDGDLSGSEADRFEPGDGGGDGGLLGGAVNDVTAAPLVGEGGAFDGEVGCFGAVRGEEDVVGGFGVE